MDSSRTLQIVRKLRFENMESKLSLCWVLFLLLLVAARRADGWMVLTTSRRRLFSSASRTMQRVRCSSTCWRKSRARLYVANKNRGDEEEEKTTDETFVEKERTSTKNESFDLEEFLDKQFFDPEKVLEDESSPLWLQRFASFVVDDYEKAEVVLAGALIAILIIVAQEVLRLQLYGENYEPFRAGIQSGRLF